MARVHLCHLFVSPRVVGLGYFDMLPSRRQRQRSLQRLSQDFQFRPVEDSDWTVGRDEANGFGARKCIIGAVCSGVSHLQPKSSRFVYHKKTNDS